MSEDKKAIDLNFLKEIIGDDKEFENELFAIFLENAQQNLTKMQDSIKNKDNKSWYMASHAFKGAAASIGAFGLSQALEYAQKHPEDNDESKNEIIQNIKIQYDLVADFIKKQMSS